MLKILLIEDEKINRVTLEQVLSLKGHQVQSCENGTIGIEYFQKQDFDIVLSDIKMPGMSGVEVLEKIQKIDPKIPVVIMTGYATIESAVKCLKKGAYDYLTKPFDPDELLSVIDHIDEYKKLNRENETLRLKLAQKGEYPDIVGQSAAVKKILHNIELVAPGQHTVLIEGESGTGKEVFANLIHVLSPRSKQKYIKVNCSALNESLFESEMFGHEKGAFTGAIQRYKGRFERAHKGTIFLDDIDDLSLTMQTKLLRVIEEREIERVGGSEVIPIDLRIIVASKQNLRELVAEGNFREDLFYRLNVVHLLLPSLRKRLSDIPLLARYFLDQIDEHKYLNPTVIQKFDKYNWPGNIRELRNVIEQMAALSNSDELICELIPEYLQSSLIQDDQTECKKQIDHSFPDFDQKLGIDNYLSEIEKKIIEDKLFQFNHSQQQVAKALGIPRTTLRSKLIKYGLI